MNDRLYRMEISTPIEELNKEYTSIAQTQTYVLLLQIIIFWLRHV